MFLFLVFFISAQLISIFYNLLALVRGYGCIWSCTNAISSLFAANYHITPNSKKLNEEPTMLCCNHRSWSDFTLDSNILGGPSYLSRMMVLVAVPFSGIVSWTHGAIWFFRRQKGISRDWFTNFFRVNLAIRPGSSVIVYPEGTRSNKPDPLLPLKTGVFQCAWNLDLPVQSVVTTNKELCLNEKTLAYRSGVTLVISVSESISPLTFKAKGLTQDDWFKACEAQFIATWKDAYECKDSKPLDRLPLGKIPKLERIPAGRLWLQRVILLVAVGVPLWLRYVA